MSALARLRDVFLRGEEPQRALFCTYGFDARFFEAEVLPAMLPNGLALDREAGSATAYLNAGDVALQRRDVFVFYDHLLGEGPELLYGAWPVDVLPRRFHAKLILLDYGDRVRVVVGSANLTRAAWTSLFELWVVEDLVPGTSHAWAGGLRQFLGHLGDRIPLGQTEQRETVRSLLDHIAASSGDERIVSTWDEVLFDALFEGLVEPRGIDVVTPFFEGSDGPGVFDAFASRAGQARGTLYASISLETERPQIIGPPEKLTDVFRTGRWQLRGVRATWDGDEHGAPMRALHGKLLAVTHREGSRVMVGSANVTRAALLGRASTGERTGSANVELVLLRDGARRDLRDVLPQADPLDFDDVDVVDRSDPTGEDEEQPPGPERHVREAVYRAETQVLTVILAPDAPSLVVSYDGRRLGSASSSKVQKEVDLAAARFVVVDDGTATGIVPFTVLDPERLVPRGTANTVDLETFFGLLAGGREPPLRPGEGDGALGGGGGLEDTIVGQRGAIPWRRYLGAVRGLGAELERERETLRGLRFVVENPLRLAGLLERLDDAYDRRRFTAADLLYALYELEREVARVAKLTSPAECAALLTGARTEIADRRSALLIQASADVSRQLKVLARADARP